MMPRFRNFFLLAMVFCILFGCWKKTPQSVQPEEVKKPVIRLVAVLPVDNRTTDPQAARILREQLLQEIFFRGYPKIPLATIDEKLAKNYKDATHIPPLIAGELLGVDAVVYCTLTEWKTSFSYVYALTTVSARFEMRSAKTGETLWKANHKVGKRNYDVSRKGLEMKSFLDYEPAIREVVDKAIQTFPEGPDFTGRPPSKGGCILWNWF